MGWAAPVDLLASREKRRRAAAGSASSPVVVNLVTVQISNYEHPLVTGTLVSGMIGDRVAITFSPIRVTMRQAL